MEIFKGERLIKNFWIYTLRRVVEAILQKYDGTGSNNNKGGLSTKRRRHRVDAGESKDKVTYKRKEAAQYLNISCRQFDYIVKERRIKGYRPRQSSRTRMYTKKELDDFLKIQQGRML